MAIDAGFDVGGGSILIAEHLVDATGLVAGRNDKGNHAGAITTGLFQGLDQFLDLPDLNGAVTIVILGLFFLTHGEREVG